MLGDYKDRRRGIFVYELSDFKINLLINTKNLVSLQICKTMNANRTTITSTEYNFSLTVSFALIINAIPVNFNKIEIFLFYILNPKMLQIMQVSPFCEKTNVH